MNKIDFRSLLDARSSEESHAPVALNGQELLELVSPISCDEFVDSYFSRISLNVKGHPQKFDHIFNWERLRQALLRGKSLSGTSYNIKAAFTRGEEAGSSQSMIDADHGQVAELLNAGATICVTDIHLADPFLAQWAQAIRAQLNFTGLVGINCYISSDGSGLPTHYDKRVATTIQIAGKKRWRFSTESAKAWPLENAVYQQGRVDPVNADVGKSPADMEFCEVELSPGDMLCLPAGAWHSARGVGFSLALNLYFSPQNFLLQLAPLVQHLAVSNQNWRGGPPATLGKTQGKMPEAVSTYMDERLDEIRQLVAEFWLESLTHEPYKGWRPAPLFPIPGVTPDQRFSVAMPSFRFIEVRDGIIVPCDNGTIKFPSVLAPVFQRLSSEEASFTIPDVLSWQQSHEGPSQDEILFNLKILYQNGIIRME